MLVIVHQYYGYHLKMILQLKLKLVKWIQWKKLFQTKLIIILSEKDMIKLTKLKILLVNKQII